MHLCIMYWFLELWLCTWLIISKQKENSLWAFFSNGTWSQPGTEQKVVYVIIPTWLFSLNSLIKRWEWSNLNQLGFFNTKKKKQLWSCSWSENNSANKYQTYTKRQNIRNGNKQTGLLVSNGWWHPMATALLLGPDVHLYVLFQRAFNATMVVRHLSKKAHVSEEDGGGGTPGKGERPNWW